MVNTMPMLIPTPRTISSIGVGESGGGGVGESGGGGVGVGKKLVSVLKEFGVEHGQHLTLSTTLPIVNYKT